MDGGIYGEILAAASQVEARLIAIEARLDVLADEISGCLAVTRRLQVGSADLVSKAIRIDMRLERLGRKLGSAPP